jgi:hypothetical protein
MRHVSRRHTLLRASASTALLLLLCACSSGGGGRARTVVPTIPPPVQTLPPAPPAPPAPDATSYRTPEYNLFWALEAIHAAEAYATGFTGNGSIVGFVDFNFEFSSAEVRYDAQSRGSNPTAVALYRAQTGSNPGSDTHGHAVAVTAAGIKNDLGTHGVAFDASVLAVDFFSMVNLRTEFQGGKRYNVSDPWTYLTDRGARIISKSFGYDAGDVIPNPPNVQEYYVTESPAQAVENGALLIASAGNESGASPILSNLDTLDDMRADNLMSGPGAFIIVGATTQSNTITSFSNRAGTARDIFMVAPGFNLTTPYNGSLSNVSGTSFSAPIVAGAAAVILQRWPALSAIQLRDILFASATDLGAPGVDAIYGHGLLNLHAALQPMGVTTFAVSGGGAPAIASTGLVLGSAFGDAPALRAALADTMILDGFGRDFRTDASRFVLTQPRALPLPAALHERLAWNGTSFAVGTAVASVALRRDPNLQLRSGYGAQREESARSVVQFHGVAEGFTWTFGSGLSLRDALHPAADSFYGGLTHSLSTVLASESGMYASTRFALGDGTGLSFGVSQSESAGITGHPLAEFRESALVRSAALGLDVARGETHFSMTAGATLEEGLVLGARSAGGLLVGEGAATMWGELAGDSHPRHYRSGADGSQPHRLRRTVPVVELLAGHPAQQFLPLGRSPDLQRQPAAAHGIGAAHSHFRCRSG